MSENTSFRIFDPAVINRVGKMQQVMDLCVKIAEGAKLPHNHLYLKMHAMYTTGSSDLRLKDYWYPIHVNVRVQQGEQETVAAVRVDFWKRDTDNSCLVQIDTNLPQDNFEGPYEEALAWLVKRLNEKIN